MYYIKNSYKFCPDSCGKVMAVFRVQNTTGDFVVDVSIFGL
jgi:hypothetical protein